MTPDFDRYEYGISMNDVIHIANNSSSQNKIIILDCCFSGATANSKYNTNISEIGKGITSLTACRDTENSMEVGGHGVFSQLLIEALKGGAANLQGHITPGTIYAYIDQALGAWDEQRPIFKTNISQFVSIRNVCPRILRSELQFLVDCFPSEDSEFKLNPSFEFTNSPNYTVELKKPYADDNNVKIFKHLQRLESVDLIEPIGEEHMYFAAMNSKSCRLTPLGKYYWLLIKNNRI